MEQFIDVFSMSPQISIHAASSQTLCVSIYKGISKGNFKNFEDYIKEAVQRFKSKFSRHPKKIKLLLQNCHQEIDFQVFTALLKNFYKTFRFIKHFQISVDMCEDVEILQFKTIISQISQSFRYIHSYTFEFKVCSNLTNQFLNRIMNNAVVYTPHLKNLHLNISRCKLFGEIGTQFNFRKLTNLQSLSLNFHHCNSQTEADTPSFHVPNKVLSRESKLKSLELNLQGTDKIHSDFLVEIGSVLARSFGKLQDFSLNLTGLKQIQDSDLEKFTSLLGPNLQKFKLQLTGCTQLTGRTLDGFSRIFSEKLKVFALSLEGLELITSAKLGSLAMCFSEEITNLESLSLNFSGCILLDDTHALQILNHIVFNVQSLKTLSLDFSRCEKLSDKILEPLHSGFYKFRLNLQNLTCKFRGLSKFTEHGVNALLKNINTSLKKLTTLILDFSSCKLLGDSNLMQVFSKSSEIRNLSLSFYSCQQVTGKGLNAFASNMTALCPQLQSLNLNLSNCKFLTPDEIFKAIKTLTLNQIYLKSFSMDLRMSSNEIDASHIKDWTEYLFRSDLNHLKNIYIQYTENYFGGQLFGHISKGNFT